MRKHWDTLMPYLPSADAVILATTLHFQTSQHVKVGTFALNWPRPVIGINPMPDRVPRWNRLT